MFNYSLFSLLRGAVFPHRRSVGLVLNRGTLAATALCETYNIPVVKKIQSIYCFFLEHKLYGFPQIGIRNYVSKRNLYYISWYNKIC